MIITYDVSCFERELKFIFPDGYENYRSEIENILDEAYDEWHSPEKIEGPEERAYVENSCCEEYMIEVLSKTFNNWIEWWVEGDVDENGDEEPVYVTKNPNFEHYMQTYITLDAEELMLLGVEPKYWDDCEVINDAIHNMIYERGK